MGVYIFFAVSLPVLYLVTVVEERELIDRFGQEYVDYRREVPRFIPRLISPRRKTI